MLPLSAPPFSFSHTAIGAFGLVGAVGALAAARAGRWADQGRGQVVSGAALVVLLFGTKKLRTLGGDLGAAIKGFKKAMNDDDAAAKKGADVDLQAEKLSHKE